jgi:TetR/AcrR family transcriptional regulator, transcriptional repressor for nem operon
MNLSYILYLEDRFLTDPPKQKGMRTRERLKIATAKILSQRGYHAMRAIDITDEAGVAEGLFYTYFKDKMEITLSVLGSMMEEFYTKQNAALDTDAIPSSGEPVYDAIFRANRKWILMCRANSGLMRCVLQVGDQEPEFANLWQKINSAWYKRIAAGMVQNKSDKGPALMFTLMLGAMMDETARKLIVYPDPDLLQLLQDLNGGDELIAHATSLVWLRILHPDINLPSTLPEQAQLLAQWLLS